MATRQDRFEFGTVFTQSFSVIGQNLGAYLITALLLAGPPAAPLAWWQYANPVLDGSFDPFGLSRGMPYWGPAAILWLISIIINAIVYGAATLSALDRLSGTQRSYGNYVADALPMVPAFVGISILTTIGIGFAMLLLIIPGLILATMWVVAVPAYIAERKGVFDSLSRSRELTRDNRLTIFGILLVAGIGMLIAQLVLALPLRALGDDNWLASAIGDALQAMIGGVIWPVLSATMFVLLRNDKEGTGEDALEQIFT